MRVLVIADVHGNLAALDAALAEPHDQVICLGDVVGYGPFPAACVQRLRDAGAIVVKGNHDRAAGEGAPPGCRAEFLRLALATTAIADAQLSADARAYLAALPDWAFLGFNERRHMFVHATPQNPIYEYLGPEAEAWSARVAALDADVVFVGHTHRQFRLRLGRKRVVNPGSVGQPKDGDPRAAFALIEDGRITLHRVAYPVEKTVAALRSTGLAGDVLDPLAHLLRTGCVPATRMEAGARDRAGE